MFTKDSQWERPEKPASNLPGPEQVQCSHILVKHKDSRRPSSWREENITRTKEEAREILQGAILSLSLHLLPTIVLWFCGQ